MPVRCACALRTIPCIACCDAPQLLHEKLAATSRQLALSERLVAALQSMLRCLFSRERHRASDRRDASQRAEAAQGIARKALKASFGGAGSRAKRPRANEVDNREFPLGRTR